jgi:hypothetical protein
MMLVAFYWCLVTKLNTPKQIIIVLLETHERCHSVHTSGFWPRLRARALRAPVFLGALPRLTGRCAPSPTITASLNPQK